MNTVRLDVVACEIPDGLDGICLALDLDLVTLHGFLDGGADVADSHVDSGSLPRWISIWEYSVGERVVYLDTTIRGILDCSQQIIVRRIKGHGESAVDNPAIDMHAKINSQDILMPQHDILLPRTRRIMRNLLIEAETSRKPHARLQTISSPKTSIVQECADAVLDSLSEIPEDRAWFGGLLHPCPGLTVDFSGFAVVAEKAFVFPVPLSSVVSELGGRSWCRSLIRRIVLHFADRVVVSGVEVIQWDPRG